MSFKCLECNEKFNCERSLHAHIKKHQVYIHEYYVKHYQRKNLLTNELLPFKNKESYFSTDFKDVFQLYQWCGKADFSFVKNYIKEKLINRIESRELKFAPNEIELYTSFLPKIDIYKKFYKSYNYICNEIGIKPLFGNNLIETFWDSNFKDLLILTDSREQEPLFFKNQKVEKLDIGDYGIVDNFNYTFVDRKSESDLKATLSQDNFLRFKRELDRARSIDCFLFIVIECDLYTLEQDNKKSYHKSNLKYIYHNMRLLQHEYKDCCQFVFTGSRSNSEDLIPRILYYGKNIWNVDMQYFINKKYVLGNR